MKCHAPWGIASKGSGVGGGGGGTDPRTGPLSIKGGLASMLRCWRIAAIRLTR